MSPLEALTLVVRGVTGDYRYERTYPATVERSYEGGAVDVMPEDDVVRGIGLQNVPATLLAPSTFGLPVTGARCLLAFAEGDPRKPQVIAWEYARDTAVVRLDGGSASVARKGDLVDVMLSTDPPTPIAGIANGSIVTSPGPPPVIVPPLPGPPTTLPYQFVGTAILPSAVRGVIIGGAAKVKA